MSQKWRHDAKQRPFQSPAVIERELQQFAIRGFLAYVSASDQECGIVILMASFPCRAVHVIWRDVALHEDRQLSVGKSHMLWQRTIAYAMVSPDEMDIGFIDIQLSQYGDRFANSRSNGLPSIGAICEIYANCTASSRSRQPYRFETSEFVVGVCEDEERCFVL